MKLKEFIELKNKGLSVWNAIDEFERGKTKDVNAILRDARDVIIKFGEITQTLVENIDIIKAIERGGIE